MAYSSSSSSTIAQAMNNKYDVFISFRGEDTRNNFTSFLRGKLHERGIRVFNDEELKRGHEISPSLLNAIEKSIIFVIVFSKEYASSGWCLEELVKIIECRKTLSKIILPIFLYVYPSDVRNQTGVFGDGFAKLVSTFDKGKLERLQMTEEEFNIKVQAWRNAMTEVAKLSGYILTANLESEYNFNERIVRHITMLLHDIADTDNDDLVGIQPIVNYIQFLLSPGVPLINVRIVGIWGMGGMGKTTVAEAVFNKIRTEFDASYFARNVREKSSRHDMLTRLRQELLSTILEDPNSNINSNFMKRRLHCKNALIVFDDVTHSSQIESLIGDIKGLSGGSRIIITTRNKQVLRNCSVEEHNIYNIGGLSCCDALELFCGYAFQQNSPQVDYCELSNLVLEYAKGVPLALKVLGSFLFRKSKNAWGDAIEKLKIIPHLDIHEVLKISYDGLDDTEKNIFLDVACFLKWEKRDFVVEFLDTCRFHPKIGVEVLIDKCLITVSDDNRITMHDLIQEMGWEIVRQESTDDPSGRTRIWHHEDIYSVFENNTGTKAIQGICLNMSELGETIHLQRSALAKMHGLRFFKLYNEHKEKNNITKVHVPQGLDFISNKLRYLCWHGCPLESLQPKFCPKNLVALDMPHSNIEQLWPGVQLQELKHINLSYSKHLRIQDLSWAPNLESLILEDCTSLIEISSSIQSLNKLLIINIRNCKGLHSLPTGIRLRSLRKVILSCCTNLKTFDPEISCNVEELFLDETAIEELSPSIENLSRLVTLNLTNCSILQSLPSNICELKSLEHLNLSGCSKIDGFLRNLGNLEAMKELNLTNCCIKELPYNLYQLSSLERLLLGRNGFESIPTDIERLSKLSYLDISYCESLHSLPQLPRKLETISACNCTSLEASSSLTIPLFGDIFPSRRINFINCFKLVEQQAFKDIIEDGLVEMVSAKLAVSKTSSCGWIIYPGNEIPRSFTFQNPGSSISLNGSNYDDFNFILYSKYILCVILEFRNYENKGQGLVVRFDTIGFEDEDGPALAQYHGTWRVWSKDSTGPGYIDSDHVFLGSIPRFYDSDMIFSTLLTKITIHFYVEDLNGRSIDCCSVKKCGVLDPLRSDIPDFQSEGESNSRSENHLCDQSQILNYDTISTIGNTSRQIQGDHEIEADLMDYSNDVPDKLQNDMKLQMKKDERMNKKLKKCDFLNMKKYLQIVFPVRN